MPGPISIVLTPAGDAERGDPARGGAIGEEMLAEPLLRPHALRARAGRAGVSGRALSQDVYGDGAPPEEQRVAERVEPEVDAVAAIAPPVSPATARP